jgi:hypothetical protein
MTLLRKDFQILLLKCCNSGYVFLTGGDFEEFYVRALFTLLGIYKIVSMISFRFATLSIQFKRCARYVLRNGLSCMMQEPTSIL